MDAWLKNNKLLNGLYDLRGIDSRAEGQGKRIHVLKLNLKIPLPDGSYHQKAKIYKKMLEASKKSYPLGLEERIFHKFSHVMEAAPESIALEIGTYCMNVELRSDEKSNIFSRQIVCSKVDDSVTVPTPQLDAYLASMNGPSAATLPLSAQIKDAIEKSLGANFPAPAKTQFLRSSDGYIRVVVTGIKSTVLPNSQFWERLDVSIVWRASGATTEIFAITDGWFGSGSNEPSSIRGYYDMETSYATEIANYNKSMLNKIVKSLLPQPAPP